LKTLALWQQEMENEQAAATHFQEYDEMVDKIATMRLIDDGLDELGSVVEELDVEPWEEPPTALSCADGNGTTLGINIEIAWQNYVDGKPLDVTESKNCPSRWREGVELGIQERLVLTASDFQDDE
jgi:hypothetical protein